MCEIVQFALFRPLDGVRASGKKRSFIHKPFDSEAMLWKIVTTTVEHSSPAESGQFPTWGDRSPGTPGLTPHLASILRI